ncbi:MAG: low molecular weight phosphotyrosine protein phosphatase [Gammaproteobacteria bacterium]|nr:low molecular weight phosphotyrosine protein phosphatase [Gammaproteobacteria bacterium]
MSQVKVLFVCMGNICRSPTAHGVFEKMVEQAGLSHTIKVDSAGTHAYHVGEQPDRRAQATALTRGFDLSYQQARRVTRADFSEFDYVLAMDADNLSNLLNMADEQLHDKIQLFLDYAPHLNFSEVPDPYYGGQNGFEQVFDMVEAAAEGLLEHIRDKHL